MDQNGDSRGGEKWPNSGYVLKLEASQYANGWKAGLEKERSQE